MLLRDTVQMSLTSLTRDGSRQRSPLVITLKLRWSCRDTNICSTLSHEVSRHLISGSPSTSKEYFFVVFFFRSALLVAMINSPLMGDAQWYLNEVLVI